MRRNEVLATLQSHRSRLRALGVRSLALFGSTARGEATEESDLDFVVELDAVTFDRYMDVKFFLEDLFQKKVDLVTKGSIKPGLRTAVERDLLHAEGL